MHEKYDNSKTLKFSNNDIKIIQELSDKHNFKSDSDLVRHCINFVNALDKKNLYIETTAKLIEGLE